MGEGIKFLSLIHRKCGVRHLIDYLGYVWCDYCEDIVDPNDILTEEEYLVYLGEKTEKYRRGEK